jgi:hypothetical protein
MPGAALPGTARVSRVCRVFTVPQRVSRRRCAAQARTATRTSIALIEWAAGKPHLTVLGSERTCTSACGPGRAPDPEEREVAAETPPPARVPSGASTRMNERSFRRPGCRGLFARRSRRGRPTRGPAPLPAPAGARAPRPARAPPPEAPPAPAAADRAAALGPPPSAPLRRTSASPQDALPAICAQPGRTLRPRVGVWAPLTQDGRASRRLRELARRLGLACQCGSSVDLREETVVSIRHPEFCELVEQLASG